MCRCAYVYDFPSDRHRNDRNIEEIIWIDKIENKNGKG